MILPCGITGFGPPVSPPADFARFKAACYDAARRLGGAVIDCVSCESCVTPSFHRVRVLLPDGGIDVLCSRVLPVVAFAEPLAGEGTQRTFIDLPALREVMEESGQFRVSTAAELTARPNSEVTSKLDEQELKQVSYWKPKRVGDIIFNYWD